MNTKSLGWQTATTHPATDRVSSVWFPWSPDGDVESHYDKDKHSKMAKFLLHLMTGKVLSHIEIQTSLNIQLDRQKPFKNGFTWLHEWKMGADSEFPSAEEETSGSNYVFMKKEKKKVLFHKPVLTLPCSTTKKKYIRTISQCRISSKVTLCYQKKCFK